MRHNHERNLIIYGQVNRLIVKTVFLLPCLNILLCLQTTPMGGGGGVASAVSERMSGAGSCGLMNGSGDMWALKPDDSIVSPSFLFQVCGVFFLQIFG